jgi:hypothetical protein
MADCAVRSHCQRSTNGTTASPALLKLKRLNADYLNDGILVPGRERASPIWLVFQSVFARTGPPF